MSLIRFAAALIATASVAGCGYMVGPSYGPEIRTVHVPVFKSDSFRRGYEVQLTEAVQKQIQQNTTLRLTKEPGADTRLLGRIVEITKRVENQNKYDDPRELEVAFAVEVRWEDCRTGALITEQTFPVSSSVDQSIIQASFAPEAGQSMATATKDAMDQLARHIVQLMEVPW
jgi:hypothetical protein